MHISFRGEAEKVIAHKQSREQLITGESRIGFRSWLQSMREDFAVLGKQDRANPRHLLPRSMLCRCMRIFMARSRDKTGIPATAGGTSGEGSNIGTVPTISGRLATMLSPSFTRADASACRIWKNLTAPPSRARRFPSNDQSTVININYSTFCRGVAVYPPDYPRARSARGGRADKPATPRQKVE